jgi:integrator complex subunit 5
VSGEGCKQLALLLVEVISPDIMYNGLPWPEDEFMKVSQL